MSESIYYSAAKSLCSVCKEAVEAKILFQDNAVFLDKFCPRHGTSKTSIASSVDWYLDALSFPTPIHPPHRHSTSVVRGCPFDCGLCPSHQQQIILPVVPITSACNLDCPVCYTINKNENAYYLSLDGMRTIISRLRSESREPEIINFTGGEPTLHPQLPEIIALCHEAGIRRITLSTNGLRLLNDDLLRQLARYDTRIILSFHSFNDTNDRSMTGCATVEAKTKLLQSLERMDIATTILPTIATGVNDEEIEGLLNLMFSKPNILSLELHTIAFTGQGGGLFPRTARTTIPDLHGRIAQATGGRITGKDFVPSPLAHPHCYSICYLLLLEGGGYIPFTRLTAREHVYSLLQESLYIEPGEHLERVFRDIIDDLWANPGKVPEGEAALRTIRRLLSDLFPTNGRHPSFKERQKIAERSAKAIYIHSHMDEENFETGRLMNCCVGVPDGKGGYIPTCAYNVLHRARDGRFADPRRRSR